jgi:hypothetical protein
MFQGSVENGQEVSLRRRVESGMGYKHQLFELQDGSDNFLAEVGEVIAVRVIDFLDGAVEVLQQARHLTAGLVGQVVTEGSIF